METRRIVTVYSGQEEHCVVEEWDRLGNRTERWHSDLTFSSLDRIAHVIYRESLSLRPFFGGGVGYVADMPGRIITRKENSK